MLLGASCCWRPENEHCSLRPLSPDLEERADAGAEDRRKRGLVRELAVLRLMVMSGVQEEALQVLPRSRVWKLLVKVRPSGVGWGGFRRPGAVPPRKRSPLGGKAPVSEIVTKTVAGTVGRL